jgi:hypothetical protein
MRTEKDFLELGREKMDQVKAFLEELEVQIALGKAEAKDVFEREKHNFMEFVEGQRNRMKKEEELRAERIDALEAKVEALAALLAEPEPETAEAYDVAKEALLRNVYQAEAALKEAYSEAGARLRPVLDNFRAALDTYRIQLALSSFEISDEVKARKEELDVALAELMGRFRADEKNDDKLQQFAAEMETAFDHMKKAVKELIKS